MKYLTQNRSKSARYSYKIHLLWNEPPQRLIIRPHGVLIFMNQGLSVSNITPCRLFPNVKRLNKDQIKQIVDLVEQTGFEGCPMEMTDAESDVRQSD